MELFRVISVVDDFPHNNDHYNQVKVHWFVADRKMPVVHYKKVVKDFDAMTEKDKIFTREFIKEMFTMKEAEQVKQYLESALGWKADITPCQLPTEGKCLGFRAHEIGGLTGFHKLNVGLAYDLPFKVWGYYNVDGLAPIGGFANAIRDFVTKTRKMIAGFVNRPISKDNGVV